MTVAGASDRSRRVFLLTHPRTASNLLVRILNLENQPALSRLDDEVRGDNKNGYFFLPIMPLRLKLASRRLEEWTQNEYTEMMVCLQACVDELVRHVELAEAQGRGLFVKEHLMWILSPQAEDLVKGCANRERPPWKALIPAQGPIEEAIRSQPDVPEHAQDEVRNKITPVDTGIQNETVLPDSFLRTWTPTFLIRHPALVFPSIYRTSVELEGVEEARKNAGGMFRLEMTWTWSRKMWEWFNQEDRSEQLTHTDEAKTLNSNDPCVPSRPIILDADDVILHPNIISKYCKMVGLESEKCRFEWERASAEEQERMHVIERRMKSSLLSSTGVIQQGKTALGLDMEQEARKWSKEFGEEEAKKIETWVAAAMPDYEYLRARRLTI